MQEKHLQDIFDTIPMSAIFWDMDFNMLFCNQEYLRTLKLKDKQTLKENFLTLMPEYQPDGTKSSEKFAALSRELAKNGKAVYEWAHHDADGNLIIFDVTTVYGEYMGIPGFFSYSKDLSEVAAAQADRQKAQEANEQMLSMFDSLPIAMMFWDNDFNLLYCNDEAALATPASDAKDFRENFFDYVPELQPCGTPSKQKAAMLLNKAKLRGRIDFEWSQLDTAGNITLLIVTAVTATYKGNDGVFVFCTPRNFAEVRADLIKAQEANEQIRSYINIQLMAMLDTLPITAFFIDTNFNILFCNQACVTVTGAPSKEVFQQEYINYLPEYQPCGTPSAQKIVQLMSEVRQKGKLTFALDNYTAAGNVVTADATAAVGVYEGRDGVFIFGDSPQLDAAKQDVQKAMASNEQMRAMLDTIPVAMAFIDKNFNILYTNKKSAAAVGAASKQEFIDNFTTYIPRYQPCGTLSSERMTSLMAEVLETGRADFEWTYQDTDGNPVPVESTAVMGEYMGEAVAFVYSTDVRKIKAVEERLQFIFDTTPLMIDYWDKDGNCIDCNQFSVDFYELESKDEYKDKFLYLMPPLQPDGSLSRRTWLNNIHTTFSEGQMNFPFVAQKKNGDPVYFDVLSFSLKLNDEPVVATFARNVTETAQKEIALANSEAKSRFLARMSHEIRTPLSVVLGIAQIELQNPNLPDHLGESFLKIHDSATMLLNLVNDILDLSKVEAGKMQLTESPYEIVSLVGDIVNLHTMLRGGKNITFKLDVCENLPVSLIGDFIRIKQILNNLLSNAFKYTDTGTVELILRAEPKDGHVELLATVRDTGMGMDADQLERLFSDYSRFHERERPATIGTGLGMAIVHSLVQLMNGKIDIDSQVGVGTSITLRIPQTVSGTEVLGQARAGHMQKLNQSARSKENDLKFTPGPMPYGKVLVVDDLEANLYVVRGLLANYSLQVETCISGCKAIEKIKSGNSYDIIFMDQMMPGLNGTETMHMLREHGYTGPIVALTANAILGQAEEFIQQGFDGFISKPISTRHLDAVLVKFIKDKYPEGDFINNVAGKLRTSFTNTQKNAIQDMRAAFATGDYETIHRKAYSLKGLATLIGEDHLVKAAAHLEELVRSNRITSHDFGPLEAELQIVLDKFM